MLSVNTNSGAMIALQYLNQTLGALTKVQNAINSGMSVSSAKDDGATFAPERSGRRPEQIAAPAFVALSEDRPRNLSPLKEIPAAARFDRSFAVPLFPNE